MVLEPPAVHEIASAIRAYLAAHPNASDSLAGVQRWWISMGEVEASRDAVRHALELLIEKGVVTQKRLSDGTAIYGAAHRGPNRVA